MQKITKAALLKMLEHVAEETELEFFHGSIHYDAAVPEAIALAKFPGLHPTGVYMQVAS